MDRINVCVSSHTIGDNYVFVQYKYYMPSVATGQGKVKEVQG